MKPSFLALSDSKFHNKAEKNGILPSKLAENSNRPMQKFYCQKFLETIQLDYTMAGHPSRARWVINSIEVNDSEQDTHFLFVSEGEVTLKSSNGEFLLRENGFATVPGNFSIDGSGQVLVATLNYHWSEGTI